MVLVTGTIPPGARNAEHALRRPCKNACSMICFPLCHQAVQRELKAQADTVTKAMASAAKQIQAWACDERIRSCAQSLCLGCSLPQGLAPTRKECVVQMYAQCKNYAFVSPSLPMQILLRESGCSSRTRAGTTTATQSVGLQQLLKVLKVVGKMRACRC